MLLIKSIHPEEEVWGLDGGARILKIARQKAEQAGLEVKLDEAMSDSLPYTDESFDRVLSSLFLTTLHLHTRDELFGEFKGSSEQDENFTSRIAASLSTHGQTLP